MKRKFLSIFMTLTLVLAAIPFAATEVSAFTLGSSYEGKACTSDSTAASVIDYVKSKYKHLSTYTGPGECWGYAEKVSSMLASSRSTKYYDNLRFTKENFKNKCLNTKAGLHLRLSRNKKFNAYSGHSIVIFKATEDEMYWADNNYYWSDTVAYYSGTMDDFMYMYGQYGYLNMVAKPTKYKTYSTPQVSSRADYTGGKITLTWLKTTNTKRYDVYRSYSKNGTYKRIAQVTSRSYSDSSASLGKKAYYKIKSVKNSGSKYSGVVSNTLKLAAPKANYTNDPLTGAIVITWDPVAKADRYKVYRKEFDGKEKLIKTTTECSFTDNSTPEYGYIYRVKAIYDKNTNANSNYSKEVFAMSGLPGITGLNGYTDGENTAYLSWNPVNGADYYEVYCGNEPNWDECYYVGDTISTQFIDEYREIGEYYYYCIVAWSDEGSHSQTSQWIRL